MQCINSASRPRATPGLQALAESREWQLLGRQLATVKGVKLLQACHMVLRHTQAVARLLPPPSQEPEAAGTSLEGRARQLLAAMCDERLMPTHWLNEVCSVVLHLCVSVLGIMPTIMPQCGPHRGAGPGH